MPGKLFPLLFTLVLLAGTGLQAQRITYSKPDPADGRQLTDYEIVGRYGPNVLIYKNYRDDHFMTVYDPQMKQTAKNKLDQVPERVISASFINYPEHVYMIYQYQKKNVVYCMGQKISALGKPEGDPIEMDTTHISFWASNKVYNLVVSEDKNKLAVFKLNTKNDKVHQVTTAVFDQNLRPLQRSYFALKMPERHDFLTEFVIDNDGDIAFLRASSSGQGDNINNLQLFVKPLWVDSVKASDIDLKGFFLDDLRLRALNGSSKFLITSFSSKTRRGNIEGIFNYLWDKQTAAAANSINLQFTDELRQEAKGGNTSFKTAFNDYFLRNIVMREDGGYVITAESIYSTSRGGNPFNRWDYFGSPFAGEFVPIGVNPYMYPWWRTRTFGQSTRFFADNVLVLSFDHDGKMEWSNLVRKSQFDDNTDDLLGYAMMNTGAELHFLFNQQERKNLMLSDQSIGPTGQLTRRPTLRNLDRGYEFIPRRSKQVGAKTIIFPCQYRNYICFAKVDYN